jgi:hypothetical protein
MASTFLCLLCNRLTRYHRNAFKGSTKDDYPLPAAHYEMAVIAWAEVQDPELWKLSRSNSDVKSSPEDQNKEVEAWRRKKTEECQSWLEKVSAWDPYILDARFGMRLNTGLDTLRWYKREHGWASG